MERLGYNNGILTKFHQECRNDADYSEKLELLEYDMLYGERYVYNQVNPYDATDMTMGIDPITITTVWERNGNVYVMGENFTDSSYVFVNGDKKATIHEGRYLVVKDFELEDGDRIRVRQLAAGKSKIGKTQEYIYQKTPLEEIDKIPD